MVSLIQFDFALYFLILPRRGRVQIGNGRNNTVEIYKVNAVVQSIRHHFVKTATLCSGSRTDPFIRIYSNELPILAPLYVVRVIIHLRLVAGLPLLMVCADTGIACHPALFPAVDRSSRILAMSESWKSLPPHSVLTLDLPLHRQHTYFP